MDIKEIVKKYEKYLKNDDYDKLFEIISDDKERILLINFLINGVGINPLLYMSEIPKRLFQATNIKTIEIPNKFEVLPYECFYKCDFLKSITIPNSVEKIGEDCFYFCTSLQSITIPNSVKIIDFHGFAHCKSLQSITIPNSVEEIGNRCFKDCYSLRILKTTKGSYAENYFKEKYPKVKIEYI